VRGWAREGLSDKLIAKDKIGVAVSTFCEWKTRFPEFAEALKSGKEVADFHVENALYEKAVSGDVTAMIFWLKNRKPKQWRDRPDAGLIPEDMKLEIKINYDDTDRRE